MVKKVNVSILQMSSVLADIDANIEKISDIIKKELPEQTDVLVLPEVWSCGWSCDKFIQTAQSIEKGSIIDFLKYTAKKYGINVIG